MTRIQLRAIVLISVFVLPVIVRSAGNNWMEAARSDSSLTELSIPGTHNSCALYEYYPGTAKCQDVSIRAQLNMGVRFLDIRLNYGGPKLLNAYHGYIDQKQTFDDLLTNTVQPFLKKNPSECVVMSIKEENSEQGYPQFSAAVNDYIQKYCPAMWYLGQEIPTVGQSRGKIVLLRRFQGDSGIDASEWPNNTTFSNRFLAVEDCYDNSSAETKWKAITENFAAARKSNLNRFYITFTSGYQKVLGIPRIPHIAKIINPLLTQYLSTNTSGRYGIIPMDFVDAIKCQLVYQSVVSGSPPDIISTWQLGGESKR